MAETSNKQKHFVLVHGACHGAWCWYKLMPLLQNSGHRVTALDMAASGINLKRIDELDTILDYSEPLIKFMESLSDDQKVILVGHSLGGLNLAVAMERFPHKIELAVFLAAFMPDPQHSPSSIFDKFAAVNSPDYWLDTEFKCSGDPKDTLTTMFFGTKFLAKMYHLSPVEDLELLMRLERPSSLFLDEESKAKSKLSNEKHGSVRRVYVVCEQDLSIIPAFQRWMIDNGNVEFQELQGADHMSMFCMPHQLCHSLLHILYFG